MFKVTARTVLELGSELISSDIIAFYELIKNGFDAGTKTGVEIRFTIVLRRNSLLSLLARLEKVDKDGETLDSVRSAANQSLLADAPADLKSQAKRLLPRASSVREMRKALNEIYLLNTITVSDTGSGMSVEELENNFLVIGTPSRKKEVEKSLQAGDAKTPFLGEKGIGRLSAMRLGNRLRVETARKRDHAINLLEIDWNLFANLDAMLDEIKISPSEGGAKPSATWSGTNIVIRDLAEDWTGDRVKKMAEYDFARLTDPFLDQKERPRIVLFWNGERLAIPWMNQELIAHAHASVSGRYEIKKGVPILTCVNEALNLGFSHPKERETTITTGSDLEAAVLGTDEEAPHGALKSIGPFTFEAHWYNRRRLSGIDGIGELRVVRDLQEKWSGILLFRDNFRVFPYGEDEDDWLALDRKALRRSGYTLNKTQFIGRVSISRTANPELVDQTNREGLRETMEQKVFLEIMTLVIQDRLFGFLKSVEKQYKSQKVDLEDAKSEVASLQARAKNALKQLRRIAPAEGKEAVDDLEQALFEFTEFADKARQRIGEVEQESRQMIDMAGIGLMVEVVAHELARVSENALEQLEKLRGSVLPDEVKRSLESLRSQMKSLNKRLRILDPMSVSGRQRSETFDLAALIRDTIEAHKAPFERHQIQVKLDLPKGPMLIKAVKGMVVQILENLISNSKYWLKVRKAREKTFAPKLTISLQSHPPTMIYEDNGPGIAEENREKIFKPFFSLKEKAKRRGLGLFIARECAEFNDGTLILDDESRARDGRLNRFILELPERTVAV